MLGGTTEDQSGKVEQGVPYSYGLCSTHAFTTFPFPAKVFCSETNQVATSVFPFTLDLFSLSPSPFPQFPSYPVPQ